jgi:hypothetical protein
MRRSLKCKQSIAMHEKQKPCSTAAAGPIFDAKAFYETPAEASRLHIPSSRPALHTQINGVCHKSQGTYKHTQ